MSKRAQARDAAHHDRAAQRLAEFFGAYCKNCDHLDTAHSRWIQDSEGRADDGGCGVNGCDCRAYQEIEL